jgi:hypothetical protein
MTEDENQVNKSEGTPEKTRLNQRIDPKEPEDGVKVGLSGDRDAFLRALGKKPKS